MCASPWYQTLARHSLHNWAPVMGGFCSLHLPLAILPGFNNRSRRQDEVGGWSSARPSWTRFCLFYVLFECQFHLTSPSLFSVPLRASTRLRDYDFDSGDQLARHGKCVQGVVPTVWPNNSDSTLQKRINQSRIRNAVGYIILLKNSFSLMSCSFFLLGEGLLGQIT